MVFCFPSLTKYCNTTPGEVVLVTVSHWSSHSFEIVISSFFLADCYLLSLTEINPFCLEHSTAFYLKLFPQYLWHCFGLYFLDEIFETDLVQIRSAQAIFQGSFQGCLLILQGLDNLFLWTSKLSS
jgi:hypothetical protein